MNVLMLADGTSVHSRRVLDWHLRGGCTVTFVDFHDPIPQGAEGYRYVPYPGLSGARYLRKLFGPRLTTALTERAVARALRHIAHTVRPDVVHLYQIDRRAYHCLKAGLRPLVMSSWGTDINQHFVPGADPAYRRKTAQALAGADLVIADAADVLEKCALLAGGPIPGELLPLGIDTDLFRPGYREEARLWRDELAIPTDARLLFSIRALAPLYGHGEILEAFHQALPRFREDAVVVFKAYNTHGASDYERRLRGRAKELGVADRVRWADAVPFERLPALYAAADVIVNYPSMDGFPVTFLEAAACQRVVVTNQLPSYVGTLAEKYFRLVEPGNTAALADALVAAVNGRTPPDSPLLVEARTTVETHYSQAVAAERLIGFYRELARRCGPSGERAKTNGCATLVHQTSGR